MKKSDQKMGRQLIKLGAKMRKAGPMFEGLGRSFLHTPRTPFAKALRIVQRHFLNGDCEAARHAALDVQRLAQGKQQVRHAAKVKHLASTCQGLWNRLG